MNIVYSIGIGIGVCIGIGIFVYKIDKWIREYKDINKNV
jgi:capsular polysaccharide biosynthesis protein